MIKKHNEGLLQLTWQLKLLAAGILYKDLVAGSWSIAVDEVVIGGGFVFDSMDSIYNNLNLGGVID